MYRIFFLEDYGDAAESSGCPIYKWIDHPRSVRNSVGMDLFYFPGGIGFCIKNYSFHKKLNIVLNLYREDGVCEHFILEGYYVEKLNEDYEKWQTESLPLYPYDSPHGRITKVTFSFIIKKDERFLKSIYEYKFAGLWDFDRRYVNTDDFLDSEFISYNTFNTWNLHPATVQMALREINSSWDPLPLRPSFTRGEPFSPDHPRQEIHKLIDFVIERKKRDPRGKHYIHLAVFNFENPYIGEHLIHAFKNGVEIECIGGWEQVSSMDWHEYVAHMKRTGIPVYGVVRNIPHNSQGGIASMHTKIIIFDGQVSMTASFNLDFHKWGGNWENGIFCYSPHIALLYENIYQAVKGGRYVSPEIDINCRFNSFYSFASYSSTDGRNYMAQDVIIREIDMARNSIVVVMFDINYLCGLNQYGLQVNCIDRLIEARWRGVNITIVLNGARAETGEMPEEWDKDYRRPLRDPIQKLVNGGINVIRLYNTWDIYSPLHHKFAVFDEYTVITGSYNWYTVSTISDEEMVLIRDGDVARKFLEEFKIILDRSRLRYG